MELEVECIEVYEVRGKYTKPGSPRCIVGVRVVGPDGRIYCFIIDPFFRKRIGPLIPRKRRIIAATMPPTLKLTDVEFGRKGRIVKALPSGADLEAWVARALEEMALAGISVSAGTIRWWW